MTFASKLAATARANQSLLCVGLDPDPTRLPVADVAEFCLAIVEATRDLVSCYKPNVAFFEQLGKDGFTILDRVRWSIGTAIPVIVDAKRGDIGNTADAYARAWFEQFEFDAITASPYLGHDSLQPFLKDPSRTTFVLCRTSNPGAGDLQDLPIARDNGSVPLYEVVAERCRDWNTAGNVGLVVGSTYPAELARVRAICPEQPILVPGIGAQGGDLEASVAAGRAAERSHLIISASRQVLYAGRGSDFASAARSAAEALRSAINEALNLSIPKS